MKVILIKDVARLGRRGEVKEVPNGHALNFLIPRKLAIIATEEGMKRLNEEIKKHGEKREHAQQSFTEALARLEKENIPYPIEANDKGVLFKGISAQDIAEQFEKMGIPISRENIMLKQPIKEVGIHDIVLTHGKIEGVCKLEVIKK